MTKWADQIYFKSAIDAEKIGGIGILHTDNSNSQKIYLGCGREPWNNAIILDNGDAIFKEQGKIIFGQNSSTNLYKSSSKILQTDGTINAKEGFRWNGVSLDDKYFLKRGNHIIETTNWNSIVETGTYKVQMSNWGNENLSGPNEGYSYGLMNVFRPNNDSENRVMQIYYPHTSTKTLKWRMSNNGVWTEWKNIDDRTSNDSRYVLKTGDTMTGNLFMSGGKVFIGSYNYGYKCTTKDGGNDYVLYIDTSDYVHVGYNGRNMKLDALNIVNQNNHKIWHEDNDGKGSGLDADLLDGIDSSNFMRRVNPPKSNDCNDFKDLNAFFTWDTGDGAFKNTPLGNLEANTSKVFVVKNFGYAEQRISQECIFMYPNNVTTRYVRSYADINSGWGSWQKVYTSGDKPTADEIGAVSKRGGEITGDLAVNSITLSGRDVRINNKRALVGFGQDEGNALHINYSNDFGEGVIIRGNVDIQDGAVKSLNGFEAKFNPIRIASGQNLNDYTKAGMYFCPSDVESTQIANCPYNCAFSLLVERHAGIKQTFTCYWRDNPVTYIRNNYSGSWGAWVIQCDANIGPNGRSWNDKTTNWNKAAYINSDGVMEVGKYIDFHNSDRDGKDYEVRLEAGTDGMLYCYPGFVGNDIYVNKYVRIRDWYGAADDGKIWFKSDGKQLITENVEVFQSKKLKAKEGGITSEGPIYAWQHNITTDKDLIFGGKCLSTIQSGGANLYCEGRGGSTHGWHFADVEGSYADIYAKIYRQQSDARTKEEVQKNISLLKDNETVLEKISKVIPREFYYADDTSKKILYGFFAQELESEFPIAVNTLKYSKEEIESGDIIFPKDKNGQDIHDLKSIDPVAISAIMWDALKEVYNSLEMQKIKNKELLDRIKVLEEKTK